MKKFIIPAIATLIFIAGLVSLLLPFVPLGWLLIALSALLLAPYLKFMRTFIGWLTRKDRTGIVEKAGKRAAELYRWADDPKRAKMLESILKETAEISEPDKSQDRQNTLSNHPSKTS